MLLAGVTPCVSKLQELLGDNFAGAGNIETLIESVPEGPLANRLSCAFKLVIRD